MDVAVDGTVKIGFSGEDWFGPGRPSLPPRVDGPVTVMDQLGTATSVTVVDADVRCSVRAYEDRPLVVFRCEATIDLDRHRDRRVRPTFDRMADLHPQVNALKVQRQRACAPLSSSTASSRFPATPVLRSTAGSSSPTGRPPAGLCCSPEKTAERSSWLHSTRSTNRPSASTTERCAAAGTATWNASQPASRPILPYSPPTALAPLSTHGAGCSSTLPVPSALGAGRTRSVRARRTGPTTARPTGTRRNLDTTSPDRSSRLSMTCGSMASRSGPCSWTRGSTPTLSFGHSTPRNGSCRPAP